MYLLIYVGAYVLPSKTQFILGCSSEMWGAGDKEVLV